MGLCDSCKDGKHALHRGRYTVPVMRKGKEMRTRSIDCDCVTCTRDGSWRGDPQPVPRWGSL